MKRISLLMGATSLLLAAPVVAQVAPGRSGSSSMSYLSGRESWEALSEFGKCYANYSRDDAIKLVAARPGSPEEIQVYRKLFSKAYQSCLGDVTELNFDHGLVRGAIAEGLFLKKVPVPVDLMVRQVPDQAQVRNVSDAALCYAAKHLSAANELIEGTKPGSKQEAAAVDSIWTDFGQCIPAAVKSLTINPTLVRFRIAEALWRLGGSGVPSTNPAASGGK